jgi:HEAT repeat protein
MARIKAKAADPLLARPRTRFDLAALSPGELASESGLAALKAALSTREGELVVHAARLIREHGVSGLEDELVAAYRALSGPKKSADPGCLAKEALLRTLDASDYFDAALFADAAVYTQLDRGKTVTRDSAGRVRACGVLGLARLGHPDLWPIFGARLADPEASVRFATAGAIAHRGQRDGAGLLLLKLGVGDADPNVVMECLRALFVLASDLAVPAAQRLLTEADLNTRELTLQALGTASDDRALAVLHDELERHSLGHERAPIIEALGLSVRPRARELLFALIVDGSKADAEAAVRVLTIHRYDERLVAQLREAVEENGSRELATQLARELAR